MQRAEEAIPNPKHDTSKFTEEAIVNPKSDTPYLISAGGPQYRPQYVIILITGTSQKYP